MTDPTNQTKVRQYLSDPIRISATVKKIIDWSFQKPLHQLLLDPKLVHDKILLQKLTGYSNIINNFLSLSIDDIYPHQTLAQAAEQQTITTLLQLTEQVEVKPSREFLYKIVEQDAIKELITNIIENSIIEFNKKLNPLFGAMQMTGMDKQIKNFINFFLPTLLPRMADFIYSTTLTNEKSHLERDILQTILNSPIKELNLEQAINREKAQPLYEKIKKQIESDDTLWQTSLTIQSNLRNKFLAQHGDKTLKEFLQYDQTNYEEFANSYSQKIAEIIVEQQKITAFDDILTLVIEDILGT